MKKTYIIKNYIVITQILSFSPWGKNDKRYKIFSDYQ